MKRRAEAILLIGLSLSMLFVVMSNPLSNVESTDFTLFIGPPWAGGDDDETYSWQDSDAETPWGIERVFNGAYYGDQYTASVQVAILDSGIDLDHPDLKANLKWAVDATGRGNPDDKNGHGTHCAGIVGAVRNAEGVVGMYANVELYAIKVLGNGGSGSWDDLIIGIEYAMQGPDGIKGTADDADVISMSLGASSEPPKAVHDKIIEAYNAGIVLVAAAGNDGDGNGSTDEWSWPAAYAEVIAVGATQKDDTIASFSNSGPYIEVVAPGRSILSTYKGGGYKELSGTSMAGPHVAGFIALYIAMYGKSSPDDIRAWLHNNVLDLGAAGWDPVFGYGLIQA